MEGTDSMCTMWLLLQMKTLKHIYEWNQGHRFSLLRTTRTLGSLTKRNMQNASHSSQGKHRCQGGGGPTGLYLTITTPYFFNLCWLQLIRFSEIYFLIRKNSYSVYFSGFKLFPPQDFNSYMLLRFSS
jgi:hypothetical protein